MPSIGYIVSKTKIPVVLPKIEVVQSLSKVPEGKPCLIVGYKNVKSLFSNVNILERSIDDRVSWTFSKTEKRDCFEKDVIEFQKNVYNRIIRDVRYFYINIFALSNNEVRRLLNVIRSDKKHFYYCKNDMLYLSSIEEPNKTFGISLKMLNYRGINIKNVLKKIHSNKENHVVYNTNDVMKNLKYIECKDNVIPAIMCFFSENEEK